MALSFHDLLDGKRLAGEESGVVNATVITALVGFTISITGMTHLHVWFYNNTGSIFLAIIFHAFNNVFPTILSIESAPQLENVAGCSRVEKMIWQVLKLRQFIFAYSLKLIALTLPTVL